MGLRFIPPEDVPLRSCWQVTLLYELFMWFANLCLLNLLIAFMAGSFARLRVDAELIAYYQRARLAIEYDAVTRQQPRGRAQACLHWLRGSIPPERCFPRWLHVLMPVSQEAEDSKEPRDELAEIHQDMDRMIRMFERHGAA